MQLSFYYENPLSRKYPKRRYYALLYDTFWMYMIYDTFWIHNFTPYHDKYTYNLTNPYVANYQINNFEIIFFCKIYRVVPFSKIVCWWTLTAKKTRKKKTNKTKRMNTIHILWILMFVRHKDLFWNQKNHHIPLAKMCLLRWN